MKLRVLAASCVLFAGAASTSVVYANCDPGEIVIKFSHVTNTDKHPKGIAASLLEKRVNEVEMSILPHRLYRNLKSSPRNSVFSIYRLSSKMLTQ